METTDMLNNIIPFLIAVFIASIAVMIIKLLILYWIAISLIDRLGDRIAKSITGSGKNVSHR